MFDATVQRAINSSVQTADVNKQKPAMQTDSGWEFWGVIPHSEFVSPWGQRRRDRELRALSYAVHNGLFQGAVSAFIKRVQSTPWEVKGGRNNARYYQDMLQNSDFHDWDTWIARMLWDYLTQDFGTVNEVIGAGDANKPIAGRVLGIAHMDSLSCYSTKNKEYPIVYWNEEDGSMHQMHNTRIERFVDSPSPRKLAYGTGLCALSRYGSDANIDMLLGRYNNEMLSDLPMPGILSISGITEDQWKDAIGTYESNRRADGEHIFRQTMVLQGIDPANEIKISNTPFSTEPTNFDPEGYLRSNVNKLALSMGIDPQDIWPLSGQALGTGTQSEILHSKAQGKLFGNVLQMITRFLNRKVLPDGLEFQFKFKDSEGDQAQATTAFTWGDFINNASYLSPDEKRRFMAAQVESIRDVITDENGEVVALPDDDPKADDQEVIAPDDNPLGAVADPTAVQANVQGEDNPARPGDDNSPANGAVPAQRKPTFGGKGLLLDRGHDTRVATKDYSATKDAFTGDVAANLSDAASGSITPASFAIRMRQAISKYGKNAYLDGLESGGVDAMDETDSSNYADLLASASQYVTSARSTITDFAGDADSRAITWQKTLDPFYYAGVESADKNGMYTFDGEDGDESCADCVRLKGTSHRMKWWVDNEMRPVVDGHNFECGGWRCQHMLVKKVK